MKESLVNWVLVLLIKHSNIYEQLWRRNHKSMPYTIYTTALLELGEVYYTYFRGIGGSETHTTNLDFGTSPLPSFLE